MSRPYTTPTGTYFPLLTSWATPLLTRIHPEDKFLPPAMDVAKSRPTATTTRPPLALPVPRVTEGPLTTCTRLSPLQHRPIRVGK